jgi:hypothetical protein
MNTMPVDQLELRALEQRNRLHKSVVELKSKVRLDVKKNTKKYIVPAGGLVSLMGLLLGYSLTGIFTRH